MSEPLIRLWIVEDDESFVDALLPLVEASRELSAEAVLADGAALARHLEAGGWTPPDVVLVDQRLPGASGIELLPRLRRHLPGAGFVMLTSDDRPSTIFAALQGGASGYVLKGASFADVTRIVREVHAGGMLLPPDVARRLQEHAARTDTLGLSPREIEVVRAMADGRTQKEIADLLHLSRHTVDSHLRNVYRKLHVQSAPAAVARLVREGLV